MEFLERDLQAVKFLLPIGLEGTLGDKAMKSLDLCRQVVELWRLESIFWILALAGRFTVALTALRPLVRTVLVQIFLTLWQFASAFYTFTQWKERLWKS